MTATVTCPHCGAQTSGKFCSECGQPLAGRACAQCGAALSARAKFCPECGAPTPPAVGSATRGAAAVTTGGPSPATVSARTFGDKFPWIIAGLAVLALLATIIVVVTRREPPPSASETAFDASRATTDLASMSPREAADRLYERVARAATAGDSAQVQFFGPMALQAYANVTPLDADARLHLGLIQLNLGSPAAAEAQADTIARAAPTHLFAFALRGQAKTQRGDAVGARRAYAAFLRNYEAEIAKSLPEYQQHQAWLTEVRAAAEGGVGGPSSAGTTR